MDLDFFGFSWIFSGLIQTWIKNSLDPDPGFKKIQNPDPDFWMENKNGCKIL